ncbi:hypothetical protein SP21_49 [Salmonella phage 21]|nr:hypothetical protein SP21_49 [Salmonella phage 21]
MSNSQLPTGRTLSLKKLSRVAKWENIYASTRGRTVKLPLETQSQRRSTWTVCLTRTFTESEIKLYTSNREIESLQACGTMTAEEEYAQEV